jgi:hypothetical protein
MPHSSSFASIALQHPAKVGKLFGTGTRCVRLGEEVPLDDIGTDTTGIMFHAHLPKRVCKGCQSFLPCDHDTLSAIQLPLPSKELPLQLNSHRMRRRHGPTQINKSKPA